MAFVRSQFPAFADPQVARWAFLENAGGSYLCAPALEHLDTFHRAFKVQPYGLFELSELAGAAMDAGYSALAAWLGTDPAQLTLGPSTSANTYVLAQALRPSLRPGDQIVVTNQDHEANVGVWRRLAADGIEILQWGVDAGGELHPDDLEKLVGPRTRLVCFTLCSNLVGTLNPIAEIVAIAKRHGALVVADAVSFAPHLPLAVEPSGLDFYLFSTYKVFGTHQGVMWSRSEALAQTANQSHYFNAGKPRTHLMPSGPQHAEIAALAGLGAYFETLYAHHFPNEQAPPNERLAAVWQMIRNHETRLTERLLAGLEAHRCLRLLGRGSADVARRVSVVSLVSERVPASTLTRGLAQRHIAVRNGHFYAARLLDALEIDQTEGVLRISLVHYNTEDEVDRLLEGLAELLA